MSIGMGFKDTIPFISKSGLNLLQIRPMWLVRVKVSLHSYIVVVTGRVLNSPRSTSRPKPDPKPKCDLKPKPSPKKPEQ